MALYPADDLYPEDELFPDGEGAEYALGFGVVDIIFQGSHGRLFDAKQVANGTLESNNDDIRAALQILLKGTNDKAFTS